MTFDNEFDKLVEKFKGAVGNFLPEVDSWTTENSVYKEVLEEIRQRTSAMFYGVVLTKETMALMQVEVQKMLLDLCQRRGLLDPIHVENESTPEDIAQGVFRFRAEIPVSIFQISLT